MAKITINQDSIKPQREFKRHKVNPGTSVFRILPPFGQDNNGYPYKRWRLVWGLIDPTTGRMRPFASPLATEGRCPIGEYVDRLKETAEKWKAEERPKEDQKFINELISRIRPKTTFFYNAIDKMGTVGILEVKPTAQDQLKKLMSEYIRDYNADPTSINSTNDDSGVWFCFERTGTGLSTEYHVSKNQTKEKLPDGRVIFVDDRTPLPDNVVQGYEGMAYDVHTLYQVCSYDDLLEILKSNIKAWNLPDELTYGMDLTNVTPVSTSNGSAPSPSPQAPTAAQTATARSKVNLKLDDALPNEDDVDMPKKTAPAASAAGKAEDVFSMASRILG